MLLPIWEPSKMKLFLDKRPFKWEDKYNIYYEDGSLAYTVVNQAVPKKHKFQLKKKWEVILYNPRDMEIGRIVRTQGPLGGNVFDILLDGENIGNITKDYGFGYTRWVLGMSGWRIFGLIGIWEYDVLDENCIIMHAGTDGTPYADCGKYMLDIYYENNELTAMLVVLGMEAANTLVKPDKRRTRRR